MSLIEKNVKTIIIGSGMSGIGASVNFLKHGYDDFLIIEAENRIGILSSLFNFTDLAGLVLNYSVLGKLFLNFS